MTRLREVAVILMIAGCGSVLYYRPVKADDVVPAAKQAAQDAQNKADDATQVPEAPSTPGKLMVTVGKSLIIDSPLNITRVHVANGGLAEAVAVNPKEVLINGTAPGETSLIVWQQNGTRLVYDLTVRMSGARLDAARQQIARDFPDDDINVTFENDTAFVRGTVKDVVSAERVMAIASTLGPKAVNLLHVVLPPVEPQILLKVRFANVDRAATMDLGVNLASGAFNQNSAVGTGQPISIDGARSFSLSQAVNVFLFRKDINLAAAIQALEAKRLLELLAEPNLLAISGEQASFLAGGEFPFPVVQPTGGSNAISIMWREYGVRLNFLPTVTPRGTIRLRVAPEVSSLDYTNAVTIQGFTVPGLSSRRVQTEVELDSGQSFVIAGLLDNQTTENFSKVPGIGSIPILGKLFQSKTITRSNSELLVIITPEVVRPLPSGQAPPELHLPSPFLPTNSNVPMRHPGMDKTGPVPVKAPVDSLPFEMLAQPPKQGQPSTAMPNPNPGSNLANPTPPVPPAGTGKN